MTARPPRWQALLAELKRRRVFRAMTVYGVVGFVVLQVADLVVPVLLLPEWTYRLIGVLLLLGFPIAIVLAWAFELTPDGMRRTEPAVATELAEIVALPRRQRWPAGLLALAGTVALAAGVWLALGRGPGERESDETRASIAVLPFANMARTADAEPFVDGVHDDLLTQLSRIRALRVISRTSVQEYRDTRKNIREIAAELGVSHVLEGGVQRAGERLRMNVQLIDARTDEHVWAETYDRDLTVANIFAVQTEVAEAIADALSARLTPRERAEIAARPTESLEAYDHFQRGSAYIRTTLVTDAVQQAAAAFREAVRIDPGFAEAWAWLSVASSTLSWEAGLIAQRAVAQDALHRAEALAPEDTRTLLARGYYHYYGERDYPAALSALRRAEAIAPRDPEVLKVAGWVLRRMGRWDEATSYFERAHENDPRDAEGSWGNMAITMALVGRYRESERYARLAISLAPAAADAPHAHLAMIALMENGDTARAAAAIEDAARDVEPLRLLLSWPTLSRALAYRYAPRVAAARSDLANDTVGRTVSWRPQGLTRAAFFLQKAQTLRAVGDAAGARVHFDSARALLEVQVREIPADEVWAYQGSLHTALGIAYAGLGRNDEAVRAAELGLRSLLHHGDAITAPLRRYDLAEVYLLAGRPDDALDQLEQIVAAPGPITARSVAIDPLWAPLRGKPRFERLTHTPRDSP